MTAGMSLAMLLEAKKLLDRNNQNDPRRWILTKAEAIRCGMDPKVWDAAPAIDGSPAKAFSDMEGRKP